MKRTPMVALAVVIVAAACQDALTSPQLNSDLKYGLSSNPPPPPIDTGARGQWLAGALLRANPTPKFLQPRFSIIQAEATQQRTTLFGLPSAVAQVVVIDASDFFLPVKYTLSKDGTDGELQFLTLKNSKAVLKTCKVTMVNGFFTGKGTLTIQTNLGLLVIDCSSVQQYPLSYFERCGLGDRCFHVVFGDATLDGVPGHVNVITSCDPDEASNDEENVCPNFPEEID